MVDHRWRLFPSSELSSCLRVSSSKRSSGGEERPRVGNKENQWRRHVVQRREVEEGCTVVGDDFIMTRKKIKANLAGEKKSKSTLAIVSQAQSEIIHRRRQSNFNCKCSRKTLELRNGQRWIPAPDYAAWRILIAFSLARSNSDRTRCFRCLRCWANSHFSFSRCIIHHCSLSKVN